MFGFGKPANAAPLPDGRAYELVSPPEKLGIDLVDDGLAGSFNLFSPAISADGNDVAFSTLNALPGGVSNGLSNHYLARRSAAGWATTPLDPAFNPAESIEIVGLHGFDEGFDAHLLSGPQQTQLTLDSPPGVSNLYLQRNGKLRLITVDARAGGSVLASTANLGHVIFVTELPIGNDSGGFGLYLYDWNAATGIPTLAGRMPDGSIPPGENASLAMPPETNFSGMEHWNAVSRDASRIFFVTDVEEPEQQLFVRMDGQQTKHVSASQRTTPDPNGLKPAHFRFASEDGSRVFFTSAQKLTNDAATGPLSRGEDLYRYNVASGQLVDLTTNTSPGGPNGAEVLGVLGGAQDGSRLYFVAKGVLAQGATVGATNLYMWRDEGSPKGTITHLATGVDSTNWSVDFVFGETPARGRLTSRVTADGTRLLFASTSSLTGFPNAGHYETYLFELGRGLRCVSCNPAGTPATADALAVGTGDAPLHLARSLSDDGRRVFFSTSEQLLAADTNQVADVYQWDATTGSLSLISDGTSQFPSLFSDATPNGSDVVFVTRAPLVPIDEDENVDAYDARIGGGLASQIPTPVPPRCSGADCRDGSGPVAPAPVDAGSRTAAAEPPAPAAPQKKKKKKKKRKHRRGNRR